MPPFQQPATGFLLSLDLQQQDLTSQFHEGDYQLNQIWFHLIDLQMGSAADQKRIQMNALNEVFLEVLKEALPGLLLAPCNFFPDPAWASPIVPDNLMGVPFPLAKKTDS